MFYRYTKIFTILISFIFLTGFIPFLSLLGPSFTVFTSGSLTKASAQYIVSKGIKHSTGKDSLALVKGKIEKKNDAKNFNKELKQLVERRIELARKKLNLKIINQ